MNTKQICFIIGLSIVVGILLAGCQTQKTIHEPDLPLPTDPRVYDNMPTLPNGVVDANNQFAFDLYGKLSEDKGNIFFSPYSISSALTMTYEGARGQTADEMKNVFYFPANETERRSGYFDLYHSINKKSQPFTLDTANALWAQEDFVFLDEYVDVVDEYYDGKVINLDFKKDAEGSRLTINGWVEDKTREKIKDLIPAGSISSDTRLVLTNAIYFKGEWMTQFDKDFTQERDFRLNNGKVVPAQMMQRTDSDAIFNYVEDEQFQIVELPYSGEELSMVLLLPKEENDEVKALTYQQLKQLQEKMQKQRVNVFLPKFKFETKSFMKETLMDLGMPTAFSDQADFSGMTGKQNLFIDDVIHQAFVEVNEEGTEAAAATAVTMIEATSYNPNKPKIPEFRADHPFLFVIQQKESGNILFMGRVSDPSKN